MNNLNNTLKKFISIIFRIRRVIPKKIHRKIGSLIKQYSFFRNIFCLQYGVFVLKKSKNIYKLLSLRKKIIPFSLYISDIPSVDFFGEIFVDRSYEMYNKIKPGDIVLDIGANIGMFSIKAALASGINGKIIAFEPEPRNLAFLKSNIKKFKNISVIPKAVGDQSGKINLNIHFTSGGHFISHDINKENNLNKISIPIDKLENILKELNINNIDFVKIDVEGWEIEVLKGALNVLPNIKYFAIASYHSENQKYIIKEFLENKSFKVINYKDKTYAWNNRFLHY